MYIIHDVCILLMHVGQQSVNPFQKILKLDYKELCTTMKYHQNINMHRFSKYMAKRL